MSAAAAAGPLSSMRSRDRGVGRADPDEEARLRAHYGLGEPGLQQPAADRTQQIDTTAAQPPAPVAEQPAPAAEQAAPVAERAAPSDGSMVRSEERLRVAEALGADADDGAGRVMLENVLRITGGEPVEAQEVH